MSVKIIAGKFKHISLEVPPSARATLGRARQSLFDILESSQIDGCKLGEFFSGKTVLDCFAGSGAVGLEALSRGAVHATFVDVDKQAVATIHKNIEKTGAQANCTILNCDIFKMRKTDIAYDFIFIDPPFHARISPMRVVRSLNVAGWIDSHSIIAVESPDEIKTECHTLISRKIGTIAFCVCKIED